MMTRVLRRTTGLLLPVAVLIAGLALAPAQPVRAAEDVVTQTVDGPFDKVVTNLKRAITAQQLVVVKEVPYQQMLAMVGVKAEPMMGFEIFHPRYGKVLYENDAAAFKDAPLRILVRGSGDQVILEYRKPSAVFAAYSGLDGVAKELDQVFTNIIQATAG